MGEVTLRQGPLKVEFDPELGVLRSVFLNGIEVLRGAYWAVRLQDWSTPPNVISLVNQQPNGFSWKMHSGQFVDWHCSLTATDDSFEFTAEGRAVTSYWSRRTGLCVLHPASMGGCSCIVESPDGARHKGQFPTHVSPHQPFFEVRSIDIQLPDRRFLHVEFSGDTFETEDQRNWSDASFKTYCRPQRLPQPFEVAEGDLFRHSVRLTWSEAAPAPKTALGLMLGDGPLAPDLVDRIRALNLDHLGVRLPFGEPVLVRRLQEALKLGLTIQAFVTGFPTQRELETLSDAAVAEIVIGLDQDPNRFRGPWKVVAASGHNFTELNRQPPPMLCLDGVGFALNPQVHTFDDRSIMENVATHSTLVQDARIIGLGKPVSVGPIGFSGDPRVEDARFRTELGATWFVASFAAMVHSGAARATYFATHGPNGVLNSPIEPILHWLGERSELSAECEGGYALLASGHHKVLANATPYDLPGLEANSYRLT